MPDEFPWGGEGGGEGKGWADIELTEPISRVFFFLCAEKFWVDR